MIIRTKKVRGRTYHYLEHSIRNGKKVQKKSKYLGGKIPKNIEQVKTEFADELLQERWHGDFDKIRKNYSRELRAMPKTIREKELENFAIRFTYDTQKIEGSTLSRRETADLLQYGITPKDKPMQDVREAQAHMDLFSEVMMLNRNLTLSILLDWHWRLFNETKPDIAGKVRTYQVGIGGSKFLPPSPVEVRAMLTEFFAWYRKNKDKAHPVTFAALVHLKLVSIHPFGDGNGRITRLVMNHVLNRKGYPLLNIEYRNRSSYYNALERSQVSGDHGIFVNWFARRYTKEYKRLLK